MRWSEGTAHASRLGVGPWAPNTPRTATAYCPLSRHGHARTTPVSSRATVPLPVGRGQGLGMMDPPAKPGTPHAPLHEYRPSGGGCLTAFIRQRLGPTTTPRRGGPAAVISNGTACALQAAVVRPANINPPLAYAIPPTWPETPTPLRSQSSRHQHPVHTPSPVTPKTPHHPGKCRNAEMRNQNHTPSILHRLQTPHAPFACTPPHALTTSTLCTYGGPMILSVR